MFQVWVQTLGKDDATAVAPTASAQSGNFSGATGLLYLQDVKGNEDWHVYGVDVRREAGP